MPISLPTRRAYYLSSALEPDDLLCWIPVQELKKMVRLGEIQPSVVEEYPGGLELEVSNEMFRRVGLNFDFKAEDIIKAFNDLKEKNKLPASGVIDGRALEEYACSLGSVVSSLHGATDPKVPSVPFPSPKYSNGESAAVVMNRLAKKVLRK